MEDKGSRVEGACRYFWVALEFVAANRSRGQFINLKFKASAKIENDCELTNDCLTNPKLFLLSLLLQTLAANRAHTKVLGKSVLRDRRMANPRECVPCSMRSNCIRWGKSRNKEGSPPSRCLNQPSLSFTPFNRTCYNANPRPDALMKEQLVEMTGLSPRVIRVWFQNKRCKDKKKTIQMKLQMQQEKVSQVSWQDMQKIKLTVVWWSVLGGSQARLWRHAGHPNDRQLAGATRFATKSAGFGCPDISTAMESLKRLRPACRSR